MRIYRYDGTFEGFLCAVVACREEGERQPEFVRDRDDYAVGFFAAEVREVLSVRETALAFRTLFVGIASQDAFAMARYAFHSQNPGIEELLWRYLKLGLKVGPNLARMLAQEPAHTVNRTARQVSHEAHKFKGFVRFSEVEEGFLYARIEPQADVLPLIAPHFTGRVGDRPWMIHDIRRSQAAVFDLKSWRLVKDIELVAEPDVSTAEQHFADLWQRYFQRLAIAERHNPTLQQKHVPLRYRKHLTEFNSTSRDSNRKQ